VLFTVLNAVWREKYFAMTQTKDGLPESERMDIYSPVFGPKAFLYAMHSFLTDTTTHVALGLLVHCQMM
jgi:hypothetical protein